jgi:LmbE family N-acetylglucosaminyl deacetylase
MKPAFSNLALGLLVVNLFGCGTASWQGSPVKADAFDPDSTQASLSRWLRALQTRASFLMFTAHPDDEDGGTLVYETQNEGARGALFTITRGEGGQNIMSADLNDRLGLIRTQELLKSDRYYGVDQYFSRSVDYGFSKTPEEAIAKWDQTRLLSDAVRVVRVVRPLVIIAEFLGAAVDGHGQHQIAGRLAQQAFLAAGDPEKFPEQIREGLRPWTPLKLYARVPKVPLTRQGIYDYASDKFVPVEFFDYVSNRSSNAVPAANLVIHEGQRAPVFGLAYIQTARLALSYQKTQGGDGTLPGFPFDSTYHRYGSRVPAIDHETSFFDGVDTKLAGIESLTTGDTKFLKDGLTELSRLTADALNLHNHKEPSAGIAKDLADGLRITRALIEQLQVGSLAGQGNSDVLFELQAKEQQFQSALAAALDVSLEATVKGGSQSTPVMVIPGQGFEIDSQIFNRGTEDVSVENVQVVASDRKNWRVRSDISLPYRIGAHRVMHSRVSLTTPADALITRPYFTRPNEQQPYYDLIDERFRNSPLGPSPLRARARLTYCGVPFELEVVVQSAQSVPGAAEVRNSLLVGPPISLTVSPSVGAVAVGAKSFALPFTVHSIVKASASGVVRLKLPEGWRADPAAPPFVFTRYGEDQTIVFSVLPDRIQAAAYTIRASADYQGHSYTEGYHMAGYQGLNPYPYYRPAEYRVVGVDAIFPSGLKIAFLSGTDDETPEVLRRFGQNVSVLTLSDLLTGDLDTYDSIILGTRAYTVHSGLKSVNDRLFDYVRRGGVLVVQYNLQSFAGPYPFALGANPQKVVDENSPVTLLEPTNPALSWPNKITDADFRDWAEERGHGFLNHWDSHYVSLLETHDPGQDPQKGGLLMARYGNGFYIYDAFALYRQLPAGVPGAFRILANLVSVRKNPGWN